MEIRFSMITTKEWNAPACQSAIALIMQLKWRRMLCREFDDIDNHLAVLILNSDRQGDNMTIDFHFQSASIVKYRTDVTFSWLDLMVSFGGIAGLFLGCSILSGVEIIYYLIIMALMIGKRLKSRAEKFFKSHSNQINVSEGRQKHKHHTKAENVQVIKIQSLSEIDKNLKKSMQNTNRTRY